MLRVYEDIACEGRNDQPRNVRGLQRLAQHGELSGCRRHLVCGENR